MILADDLCQPSVHVLFKKKSFLKFSPKMTTVEPQLFFIKMSFIITTNSLYAYSKKLAFCFKKMFCKNIHRGRKTDLIYDVCNLVCVNFNYINNYLHLRLSFYDKRLKHYTLILDNFFLGSTSVSLIS